MTESPEDGDRRPLPWHHRLIVRYGPLGLTAVGLALLVVTVVTHRSDALEVAYVTLGTVMVVAGVLIPRFRGPVEGSTTGVKGQLIDLHDLDPRAFLSFGPGAARPVTSVANLILPELLVREQAEPVLMMPGPTPIPVPVRPSDVTIQSIVDEAVRQDWAITRSGNHVVLTAKDGSQSIALPGHPGWHATRELLRVVRASGLSIPESAPGNSAR